MDHGGRGGGRSQLPLGCVCVLVVLVVVVVQPDLGRGHRYPVRPGCRHHLSALEALMGVS